MECTNWLFLLPFSRESVVLDFGFDSVSSLLSLKCNHVFVLETKYNRSDCVLDNQTSILNIRLVKGDALKPPFASASFDMVIIDESFMHNSVSRANANFPFIKGRIGGIRKVDVSDVLLEIHQLLRPNGHFCVAIRDRYCLKSAIQVMKERLTRRTFGSSIRSYRKLLKKSGFREIKIYGVLPGYDNPRYVMPYGSRIVFKYFLESNLPPNSLKTKAIRSIGKIALLLRQHEYLFPSLLITATKDGSLQ